MLNENQKAGALIIMITYKPDDDRGQLHVELANTVSDVIATAIRGGMQPAEALQTAAFVCADYARTTYGDESIALLAKTMAERADAPEPQNVSNAVH
jgi:hypothetical protein